MSSNVTPSSAPAAGSTFRAAMANVDDEQRALVSMSHRRMRDRRCSSMIVLAPVEVRSTFCGQEFPPAGRPAAAAPDHRCGAASSCAVVQCAVGDDDHRLAPAPAPSGDVAMDLAHLGPDAGARATRPGPARVAEDDRSPWPTGTGDCATEVEWPRPIPVLGCGSAAFAELRGLAGKSRLSGQEPVAPFRAGLASQGPSPPVPRNLALTEARPRSSPAQTANRCSTPRRPSVVDVEVGRRTLPPAGNERSTKEVAKRPLVAAVETSRRSRRPRCGCRVDSHHRFPRGSCRAHRFVQHLRQAGGRPTRRAARGRFRAVQSGGSVR